MLNKVKFGWVTHKSIKTAHLVTYSEKVNGPVWLSHVYTKFQCFLFAKCLWDLDVLFPQPRQCSGDSLHPRKRTFSKQHVSPQWNPASCWQQLQLWTLKSSHQITRGRYTLFQALFHVSYQCIGPYFRPLFLPLMNRIFHCKCTKLPVEQLGSFILEISATLSQSF